MAKRSGYEKAYQKFNTALWRRIISHHHRWRRVEKLYNAANTCSRRWMYIGEGVLAFLFLWWATMRWSWDNLKNNTSLVYPLYQVSTLECRTLERNSMPDSCKIKLPIINNADYTTYVNEKVYTDIYTTLWWANYQEEWNQAVWAHYWVDIATAKWTPLYAIADWEVYSAWYNSAYGNVVKIKFKFNGEILFATYAHMNSISVKAWDTVTKWQKIWEVWNTWNTFWALGWYHVHFEIDKNSWWRPAYAFAGCPELDKGHSEIIANGYCRIQLFQNTKDPIVLLESVDAPYPTQVAEKSEVKTEVKNTEENHWTATWEVVLSWEVKEVTWTTNNSTWEIKEITWTTNTSTWEVKNTTWETKKVELPEAKPVEQKPLAQNEKKNLLELNFDWLDIKWKEFVKKWNIEIEKGFDDSVMLERSTQITIRITNKASWDKYNWALNIPFTAIASNTNISLNPVSVMLVQDGEAKITITPVKMGNTYIALNFGNTKIWGTTISVK